MTVNNQWRWSASRLDALRRLVEIDGVTLKQAARHFNTSRSAVIGVMQRNNIVSRNAPNDNRSRLNLFQAPPYAGCGDAPSPRMVRLAEFDPVVRRALNERLGVFCDAAED